MGTAKKIAVTGTKHSAGRFNTQEVVKAINDDIDDGTASDANIATNATNIATNVTNIATNVTNITTNATDITTLQGQVGDQTILSLTTLVGGGSTTTLTTAQSGNIIKLDRAAGATVTLPVWASGLTYELLTTVDVTTNDITLLPSSPDPEFLSGGIVMIDTDLDDNSRMFSATDEEEFHMNGTTTGGTVGTKIKIQALTTDTWWVTGTLACNDTPVSPWGA
jgi:hypothetical protein